MWGLLFLSMEVFCVCVCVSGGLFLWLSGWLGSDFEGAEVWYLFFSHFYLGLNGWALFRTLWYSWDITDWLISAWGAVGVESGCGVCLVRDAEGAGGGGQGCQGEEEGA